MILPKILSEDFMNEVVGIVLVHLDLFENHAALARDVLVIKDRIQHQIAQNVERNREMFIQNFDAEADALFRGEGINVTADRIHLTSNAFCRAVLGSLE